jgi:choline-glycine betaine transporter
VNLIVIMSNGKEIRDILNQRLLAYNQRTWQIPFVYISIVGGYLGYFSSKASDTKNLFHNQLFCEGLLAISTLGFCALLFLYSLWVSQSKTIKRLNELDPRSHLSANLWRGLLPYVLAVVAINSAIASKAVMGVPKLDSILFAFSSILRSFVTQLLLFGTYIAIDRVLERKHRKQ